jgi:hypothetical protein
MQNCRRLAALSGSRAYAATPRRMPVSCGSASLQSSKSRPPTPSRSGEAASRTEVAAPWTTVFHETAVLPGSNDAGATGFYREPTGAFLASIGY